MQISVENTSTLGRRLKVQVPVDEIKVAINEKMGEIAQKAQVPGFRHGKIPKNVLEQKFGQQVRQDALGKVIETSLPRALQQEDLKPAGRPVVENITNDLDKDLEYVVSFEIFPEVALVDYSKINAEKYIAKVSEKDIDKAIENLRNQLADWVVVERPAQKGDRLIVDYTSTLNGKPYENNSGKDISVEIGSNLFIEGFEPGLIGAKQNDEKTLDLHFPSDWRVERLAGKPVCFTVKVKAVTEKSLAELNEAFAKKIGAASHDEKAIRERVQQSLEKQVSELSESKLKDKITNALLNLYPIPLPKALVEHEMNILHEELHRRQNDRPQTACQHQGLAEQAEKRVTLGLILNEVIKQENIVPDQKQINQRIEALSKMFGNSEFLESMYYESEELLSGVKQTVLLDQALDFVVSKASIVEKEITVEDLFTEH